MLEKERRAEELIAEGKRAEAAALCRELIEWFDSDAESCHRAGDFGESTRAERRADFWRGRLADLERGTKGR